MNKKYFGTDGIRGRVGTFPIDPEFMLKLGWAVGKVLSKQEGPKAVLIGKDTRISGYMFESALEAGLSAAGINIKLLGPMPTPGIAYLTRTLRAALGIVISASHNPYFDNGIKFFSAEGTKLSDSMEIEIERLLEQPMQIVESSKLGKAQRVSDAVGRYIEFCKSTIPPHYSLSGLKIVVDCAHGATYHIAPNVYRELGAEVIELGIKPNGLNINNDSGSTHPEILQAKVLDEQADLGIALDGDGDRVLMVDHTGTLVDGDELLYIIAKNRLERGRNIEGVVGTQMSNLGLERAVIECGAQFHRAKVGDRYVMEALKERGWTLGGEPSGHLVCLDLTSTGDGIVSSLQVLRALIRAEASLYQARQGFQKYPHILLNIKIDQLNPALLEHNEVQRVISEAEKELAEQGRILVRMSGTEPIIRVMVEGTESLQVNQIAERVENCIRSLA